MGCVKTTPGMPREHQLVTEADKADTEIATARDTVRQTTTVAAAAAAAAAAMVEGAVEIEIATVTVLPKAERLSWKDCRWTWLKKTFDNSFSLPVCSDSIAVVYVRQEAEMQP
jgi:hypothetical protein